MTIVIIIAVFIGMEFVAWFTHKYVMHGFLWHLHEDHHTNENEGFLEKNDWFFLVFAIPSMTFFILWGIGLSYFLPFGLGILIYGIAYFLVHEVYIHRRLKWIRNINNFYFRSIRKAHKVHHKNRRKEEGECFGMLIVPIKYFMEQLKSR